MSTNDSSNSTPKSEAKPSLIDAIRTIQPVDDLKKLPTYPCARESLMYGIASGAAIGAVRTMNASIRSSCNWGMGAFIFISGASWAICRAAREKELHTMKTIVEKFPERNIKIAQKRAEQRRQEVALSTASHSAIPSNDPPGSTGAKRSSWFSWFR
ncbi:uncharacterized protein EI90DRAFT_310087 [Cantharellus anzutake]|uniref:uncharacterized protein n=1 Tax=Cantharellus anzutake TaxID=1750568 RepID=UPI001907CF10|nr:uncharacterized protein EI90DRAFT_310087 [Cantharellus anzutake]KAF8315751.1 hypothetical protein EI90DRAFT_310087 [Cantharellus anzutake]